VGNDAQHTRTGYLIEQPTGGSLGLLYGLKALLELFSRVAQQGQVGLLGLGLLGAFGSFEQLALVEVRHRIVLLGFGKYLAARRNGTRRGVGKG
jgi:hypothetical protein